MNIIDAIIGIKDKKEISYLNKLCYCEDCGNFNRKYQQDYLLFSCLEYRRLCSLERAKELAENGDQAYYDKLARSDFDRRYSSPNISLWRLTYDLFGYVYHCPNCLSTNNNLYREKQSKWMNDIPSAPKLNIKQYRKLVKVLKSNQYLDEVNKDIDLFLQTNKFV